MMAPSTASSRSFAWGGTLPYTMVLRSREDFLRVLRSLLILVRSIIGLVLKKLYIYSTRQLRCRSTDWILKNLSDFTGSEITQMLSNRYRNVTTKCQDGEYKVIIFITAAFILK